MSDAGADSTSDPQRPFVDWLAATTALRNAEARGDEHPEILRLAAEVIRTRNALTLDRLDAGWAATDDILRHLAVDERLLQEADDTKLPTAAPPDPRRPIFGDELAEN